MIRHCLVKHSNKLIDIEKKMENLRGMRDEILICLFKERDEFLLSYYVL